MLISHTRAVALALVLLAALAPAAASGQAAGYNAGWGAGQVWFGDFNEPSEEVSALGLSDGWFLTGHVERTWSVLGARAGLGFTRRPLEGAATSPDVGAFTGDLGLVLHPLGGGSRPVLSPFAAAGIGFVRFGFGTGEPVAFPEAGAIYPGDAETRFAWSAGAGFDLALPNLHDAPIALRLEFVQQTVPDSPFAAIDQTENSFGPVHIHRFTLTLLGYEF